ncbi:unnamed protein product [Cyprideis torosa]|uniref:Uncharacterized protein n=1 Tax=Cyprideis torosa TaxID=163714 RepID=A0A7R8WA92_9CRUS|nr:unnamed protein product [Cyprideis torosa]CAG0888120.1 unnamed protein product [Cyprideis torosa]
MNRNYIGDLQVYCQQRGLPLPSYVDIPNTSGIGFSVECTLNNYKKVGNGTNKKQAKQMAASLMLELVEGDGFRRECTPSPQPRGVSPAAALANFSIRGPFDSSPRRSDGEPQLSPSDSDEERVTIKVRISKGTVRRLMRTDSLTPAFRLIPLYILGEHDFDVFDAVEIAPLSAKPLDVLDPHSSSVSQISEQPNMTSFSPESSARTSPSLNLISGSVGSEDQRILEIASRQKTNPIAALQEISASRKWKPPVYDELPSDGSGFHCRCCFLDSESIGSGPNKKAAKKEAAQATLSLFLNSRGLSDSGAPYKEASTSSQATLNPIMGPFQDPLAPMALSKVTAQASTFMSPSQAPTLGVADSDPQFSLLEQSGGPIDLVSSWEPRGYPGTRPVAGYLN